MKTSFFAALLLLSSEACGEAIYMQLPAANGGAIQSSWYNPNNNQAGSDSDQWVWDGFRLTTTRSISEVDWRGGYDPSRLGLGGPVTDFTVAIYSSIPAEIQPDLTAPPLAQFDVGGNAGQTLAGTFGGMAVYDYKFILPTPFQATAGTKYWLQIEASQGGYPPDWGIALGTGGDGQHFRKIPLGGDYAYQIISGDAVFTLQATAVPEPPSLVLLGLGALTALVCRVGATWLRRGSGAVGVHRPTPEQIQVAPGIAPRDRLAMAQAISFSVYLSTINQRSSSGGLPC